MIRSLFFSVVLIFSSLSVFALDGLQAPESATYYSAEKVYFVSNMAGFISKVNAETREITELEWASGIQKPMGLRVDTIGGRLWVADRVQVIGIKLDDPADRKVVAINVSGEQPDINDLALDDDGKNAYVSDTTNMRIIKINLETEESEIFMDTAPSGPNGLLVQGDRIYVASWGRLVQQGQWQTHPNSGRVYSVKLDDTSAINEIADGFSNLDGIERDAAGNIYVGDYVTGLVSKLITEGESVTRQTLGSTEGYGLSVADIALNTDRGEIAVPVTRPGEFHVISVDPVQ